jgi:hypothetical protein
MLERLARFVISHRRLVVGAWIVLLSIVIIPIPVIRSIGIEGMLIPAVSVLTAITLLPALLFLLGDRVNRLRVMRRILELVPVTGPAQMLDVSPPPKS